MINHADTTARFPRKRARVRPRRIPLCVEHLQDRIVPVATISGNAFLGIDAINPSGATDPEAPISGISILLDGANPTVTDSNGAYTFTNVAAGNHTVSVQLPLGSNYWGFTAQTLDGYKVQVQDGQTFGNLSFSLTPKNSALIQSFYQRTLVRSSDLNGLNFWVNALGGSTTGGQALASFLSSPEFATVVAPFTSVLDGFFPGKPIDANLLRPNIQYERLGITPDAMVLNMLYSPTFVAAFGDTSQLANQPFVSFLYSTLLHRMPDPAGLTFWTNSLNNGADRGAVILGFESSAEFATTNPNLADEVSVSLAYQGILGRQADPAGFQHWVAQLKAGMTTAQLGDALLASPEYAGLQGYNDLLLTDIASQQYTAEISPLNRLQQFDTTTAAFDLPVAAGSITGLTSAGKPANLYVVAHGWAPGFTEDVLLHSTPGNPLKSWQTVQFPGGIPAGADPQWLYTGINQVSAEGLAQAITDVDPNAIVLAFSWIDDSATPLSPNANTANLSAVSSLLLASESESDTQVNGLRLASAVEQAIAPSFFTNKGLVHLLGHSHGAKVATVAALSMQEANVPVTQLSLFESPEDGPNVQQPLPVGLLHAPGLGSAQNFLWYYLQQMQLSLTPLQDNGRTANNQTLVDNYFSQYGFGDPLAGFSNPAQAGLIDVQLHPEVLYGLPTASDFEKNPQKALAELANTLFGSHDYPPPWYAQASLLTDAALQWSPLINPTVAPGLSPIYQQNWTPTPPNTNPIFSQQYDLTTTGISPTGYTPTFTPLQFAEQYQVGQVTVGDAPASGQSQTITLGGDSSPMSVAALTFTPNSAIFENDTNKGIPGNGLDFQFQFVNAAPGDRLVVWTRGMSNLTIPLGGVTSGNLGYQSLQVFDMVGTTAGSTKQGATISLDSFANSTLIEGGLSATRIPLFGFTLLHGPNSNSSVVISSLRQFNDGTQPASA